MMIWLFFDDDQSGRFADTNGNRYEGEFREGKYFGQGMFARNQGISQDFNMYFFVSPKQGKYFYANGNK